MGGSGAWKVKTASESVSLNVDGGARKERDVVREKKQKECVRHAGVSKEGLRVSGLEALFASFECELACLSPSIFVVLCVQSEGWKEG